MMAGGNPHSSDRTTTTDVLIVPLAIAWGSTTMSPWTTDHCTGSKSPVTRVDESPMIQNFTFKASGTTVGTGPWVDNYQRASFWKYVKPGQNTHFHNALHTTRISEHIVVNIANGGSVHNGHCGQYLEINLETFDPFVQSTIFPNHTDVMGPRHLVVFLLHNVIMNYDNQTKCCYFGYHQAFDNSDYDGAFQTYVVVDYDTTGSFGNIQDTMVLSHEMAEWLADPNTHNPTPAWSADGQCQKILEVADPLEETSHTITSHGFKYHVQDLAYISWFFDQSPSIGVNGHYALFDGLTKPAKHNCTP